MILYVDILFLCNVPLQITLEADPGDCSTGAPDSYDILAIRANGMDILPVIEALDPEEKQIRRLIETNPKFQQFWADAKEPKL